MLAAVTSPVTLAECLILPHRLQQPEVAQAFLELLVSAEGIRFLAIDDQIASTAAELRTRYGLALPDSFQIAVAIHSGCDAFLTNDLALRRALAERRLGAADAQGWCAKQSLAFLAE